VVSQRSALWRRAALHARLSSIYRASR
jgi:hypothetical protein